MNYISRYYYIINFKNLLQPKIYPVYFTNRVAARRAIRENVKSKRKRAGYDIIQGKNLAKYEFKYVLKLGALGKFKKYEYPPELSTHQKRKSFRTLLRRRLRRMGMLTHTSNKYPISKKPPVIKIIPNTQKVANSPNTMAICFRLERKPKNYYYIIIKKEKSQRKGLLFKIDTLRVDIKTKEIAKKIIRVQRKDIVIPYLLTEIIQFYGDENLILDRCRAEGVTLDSAKQKGVLTGMRKKSNL